MARCRRGALPTDQAQIDLCSGTASACSRRRASAPRCSISTSCSRSSRAKSSRRSTCSWQKAKATTPRSIRRSSPSSRTSSIASATRCCRRRSIASTQLRVSAIPDRDRPDRGLPQPARIHRQRRHRRGGGRRHRARHHAPGRQRDRRVRDRGAAQQPAGPAARSPAINLARGRDTGVPTLNQARAQFYQWTGDSQLKPYASWADFCAAPQAPGIARQLHRRLRHADTDHQRRPRLRASARRPTPRLRRDGIRRPAWR